MHSGNSITTQRRWLDFVHPLLDAMSVMAALAAARWCSGRDMNMLTLSMGLVAVVLFLLLSQLTGLLRRCDGGSADREILRVVVTWTLTMLALAALGFVTRGGQHFSRAVILSWGFLTPAILGLQRMCVRIVQQGFLRRGFGFLPPMVWAALPASLLPSSSWS